MNRTRLGCLLGALGGAPCTLAAQAVWHSSVYPYAYYSAIDGGWGGAHLGITDPGPADRPAPYAATLGLDASASTEGSYAVVAAARAPDFWAGWRAAITLSAARDNRLGFYGVGNDTPGTPDSVSPAPDFYRVARTHAAAQAIVARRLAGPVRVLLGAGLEQTQFHALAGPSLFASDLAAEVGGATGSVFTDRTVRGGVVVDTRDSERDPHAGVLLEGLFASGTGYTRTDVAADLYIHPTGRLVVAARMAGEGMGGAPPLASEVTMQTDEQDFVAVGGYESLRGYYDARFIGPGKLLGGLEARYAIVWVPSVVELRIVAFYDAGRVFAPGEAWRLTTAGLHQGTGGELALRFLRNALVIAGVGAGADGALFLFGTQWSY